MAHHARTSHAAVVARPLGKVCLVGCEALEIEARGRRIRLGGRELQEFDVLSRAGNTGAVYAGAVQTVRQAPEALLQRLEALRCPTYPAMRNEVSARTAHYRHGSH